MKARRAGVRDTSRILAGVALCLAWFASPFFPYAKAADAWGLAAVLGIAGVAGALYACIDWWARLREQERPARIGAVVRTALIGSALACSLGLLGQVILFQADVVPLEFFSEPGRNDNGFWTHLINRLIVSPIVEETLFRAWLLGVAWQARSLWLRLAVSCLLFPFGHLMFEPGQEEALFGQLGLMLLLLVPTVIFVWVWFRTRSILACFLTHALYNAAPALPWWLDH
jgi:membrane protease YdiL (CAAX protease family)